MKQCTFCGAQIPDDCRFCNKCGKPVPQGKICPNCGAGIADNDVFCSHCGKRLDKLPSTHESAGENIVVVNDEIYNPWKEYRIHIVGGFLVALLLGGCWWYYKTSTDRVENDKAIQQESQRLALQKEKEKLDSIENAQKEELLFVENFYKELEEYSDSEVLVSYIRKNVTDKALQTLKDEYDYECEDGECLATWLFSYEAGTEMDSLCDRKIEPVSKNTFLVTSTWGYSEGNYRRSDYRVRLGIVKEGLSYKIDKIVNVNEEGRKKLAREKSNTSNSDDLSWIQGHWVYEHSNYTGHYEISGNIIKSYTSNYPTPEIATFTIEGDELVARTKGVATVAKLDFANHRIDWGDGHWMHKVSSGSNQNYSSPVGASNSQQRQRPFIDGQDIMARLYNQRFRHSSGLEIRIDGYGRIEIDGDPAGVLSVLRSNSESALLRYGHGMYGDGKILLRINGNKLLLQDPVDGSVFYQR